MPQPATRTATSYRAGRWQTSGSPAVIISENPATEQPLGSVQASSVAQVDQAVAAARAAFASPAWRGFGPADRARAIGQLADLLDKHHEELARLVVDEVGSPITLARALQVGGPIEALRWYAEAAVRGPRGAYQTALPPYHQPVLSSSLVSYEPIGVVAAIPAYNYPINLLMWKLGGVLASGCTAVVLPSPRAVLTTLRVFELLAELDLPPGVVNLVVGGSEVGQRLTTHPDVDMVSFTGSDAVGSQVMAQAAGALTKTVLELGGKAANILLPGQPVAPTVAPSVLRFARNAGQGCAAWTRLLVPEPDVDEFCERARAFVDTLVVGDPHDELTTVGPLISAAHRQAVEQAVAAALARGGSVAAGGGRPDLPTGHYLNPTILTGLDPDDPLCHQELFAPVAVLLPYGTVDQAVRIANRSAYGLAANVFGELSQALPVAGRLRAGTVTINGGAGMRPDAPWGGYGRSGIGRELGDDGFAEFFQAKHIQWPLAEPARPPGT